MIFKYNIVCTERDTTDLKISTHDNCNHFSYLICHLKSIHNYNIYVMKTIIIN